MGLIDNYFRLLLTSVLNFRYLSEKQYGHTEKRIFIFFNFPIHVLLCSYPLFLERLIAACDDVSQYTGPSADFSTGGCES